MVPQCEKPIYVPRDLMRVAQWRIRNQYKQYQIYQLLIYLETIYNRHKQLIP